MKDAQSDSLLQYIVNNPEEFAQNLAKVVENTGKAVAAYVEPREKGEIDADLNKDLTEVVTTLAKVGQSWLSSPEHVMEMQNKLVSGYMDLWSNTLNRLSGEEKPTKIEKPSNDKRFQNDEWNDNEFFNFLKDMYLFTSDMALKMVSEADGVDDHTRQKAEFYVRQIVNALSPSNFVLTNPELLKETMSSNAGNLARGMGMLAEDLRAGKGELKIRQTDASKFKVGENLATTPGKVISQNDVCQLIQYSPTTTSVLRTPLLIIPPWINKFYVLDLSPEKSFIKWAVDQGHTVFVVSWVNPDEKQSKKSFTHYMQEGILDSLTIMRSITSQKKSHVLGYCVGGTLLSVTLAYLAAKQKDQIASATFLTTQVDFKHSGDLKVFVDEEQIESLEKKMAKKGYLEGTSMAKAFNLLRSNDLIWPYVVNNYLRGMEPFPFDLLYWNSDSTRMPAANHSFYLRNCYLENKLSKGTMVVAGTKLNLKDVKVPIYNLATKEDHIAPAKSVFVGSKCFGGPVKFVLSGSGHIAGVVNPPVRKKYQYWTNGPVKGKFEDWLKNSKETEGSWWTDWNSWIHEIDSVEVNPRIPGKRRKTIIEDAPGSYVMVRS